MSELLVIVEGLTIVLGILSVYLLTVGNGRGWFLGVLWILLSGFLYWQKNLLGSTLLQVFFLVSQVIGWYRWKAGTEKDLRKKSRGLSGRRRVLLVVGLVFFWIATAQALTFLHGGVVWADSFATIGSVVAQTLMVACYLECWPMWLAVNMVYVGMFVHVGLIGLALLYTLFCLLALNGWREWTRDGEE